MARRHQRWTVRERKALAFFCHVNPPALYSCHFCVIVPVGSLSATDEGQRRPAISLLHCVVPVGGSRIDAEILLSMVPFALAERILRSILPRRCGRER